MEGVTVLAEETCRKMPILLGIFIIIFVLFIVIVGCRGIYVGMKNKCVSIIFYICIIATYIMLIATTILNMSTSYTRQKVTIDESVSFIKFTEHYQIISHEGEIYTVNILTN